MDNIVLNAFLILIMSLKYTVWRNVFLLHNFIGHHMRIIGGGDFGYPLNKDHHLPVMLGNECIQMLPSY